jgi:tryptophan synthase alpha chain
MSPQSVQTAFSNAQSAGRAALIGYLPVGFPSVGESITAMKSIVAAGVDAVEIGIPYSDPVMDGPTIQAASQAALDRGVRVHDVFTAVEAVADSGVPALVMTYWNLIEQYGIERFAADLRNAGGAGLITPDLLPEEADEWLAASDKYQLDRVFLVAPSSTSDRIALTTAACRGFVYATSLMGVTGARDTVSVDASTLVHNVRTHTQLPIGVGLGVSTGEQAAEVASYADGVIVGSAIIRRLLDAPDFTTGLAEAEKLITELRDALAAK